MKILIVDDSPLMRMMLKDLLTNEGFEVYGAGTTEEAWSLSATVRPDAIIKDLFMPDCDVVDSIRRFIEHNRRVKIVICSTGTSREDLLEALKAGACDFILKPLDKQQVITVINKLASS